MLQGGEIDWIAAAKQQFKFFSSLQRKTWDKDYFPSCFPDLLFQLMSDLVKRCSRACRKSENDFLSLKMSVKKNC